MGTGTVAADAPTTSIHLQLRVDSPLIGAGRNEDAAGLATDADGLPSVMGNGGRHRGV